MSTYFENLVEATDKYFQLDVIMNAYGLLEQIVKYDEQSTMFWRERNETDNEHDKLLYLREFDTAEGKVSAFTNAYKIMTCREIDACKSAAWDEMEWLRETFELDDLLA